MPRPMLESTVTELKSSTRLEFRGKLFALSASAISEMMIGASRCPTTGQVMRATTPRGCRSTATYWASDPRSEPLDVWKGVTPVSSTV